MTLDEHAVESVKGFLDPEEGRCLYETALEASRLGPCLEVGSYCGKSTVYLGSACKRSGAVLFSIDHHTGSEEQQPGEEYFDPELTDPETGLVDTFGAFRRTLRRFDLEDTVVPLVCRSRVAARAWSTGLGLVLIDGGHSLESAYSDYSGWVSHIAPGGYLLVHDIFPDPADGGQAPYQVYRLALASRLFAERTTVRTLGVLQRRSAVGLPGDLPAI
jgi:predicted O-methyltransferase YrrM